MTSISNFQRFFLMNLVALASAIGGTAFACEAPVTAEAKLKQVGQYPMMRGHYSALEIHRVFISVDRNFQQGMILEEIEGQICRYAELRNIRINLNEQTQFPNWSLDQKEISDWNDLILIEGLSAESRVVAGGEIAIFTSDVTPSDEGHFVILRGPGFSPYKSRALLIVRTANKKPQIAMVLLDLFDDDNLAKLAEQFDTVSVSNSPLLTAKIDRFRSRVKSVQARQDLPDAAFTNEELKMISWKVNPDSSMTMNGRTMLTRQFFEVSLEARTNWLNGQDAGKLSNQERAKVDAQFSDYAHAIKRP